MQGKQQIEVEAAEVIHAVDAIRAQNEFPFVTRMTDHAEHRFTEREDLCMHGSTSLVGLIAMAIAMLAGAAVPFQAASNAALGRALGHPLWATLSSLVVSLVVVAVLLVVARVPAPTFGMAAQGPAWLWLGGVAGVAYITAALMLTPKLGAASFIVCVIAGQMLASLAIDHLGLMRLPQRPAGAWRVAGIGLILLGMVVVQMSSTTGNPSTGSASS
ncbi:MAG: DMT family transporter [Aquabacterium sp.]